MNSYDLSRSFFNWCFENPEKVSPNSVALYFFCIEHCNRLGWKEKFGLPTTMAKEAIGIGSYNTYIKALNELVDFGFIKLIEKSKNQHSSNIVALLRINKASNKALDKALIKHASKQHESSSSIDKQETKEQETKIDFSLFWAVYPRKEGKKKSAEKWNRLKIETQQKILDTLPKFLEGKDLKFVPMPETYFNKERWDDEVSVGTITTPIAEAKRTSLEEAQALKDSFG